MIHTRCFAFVCLFILAGLSLSACRLAMAHDSSIAASLEDRPNIIVLLCDDLGYGDVQCYGHPHIKTPHLNKMAESGLRLTACYSAAPVCSPSRVGLLTGRSPNRAGVFDWIPPAGNQPKPDKRDQVHLRKNEVTIPALLKQAGYATMMSGKWHCNSQFNSPDQPQPGDVGFDHWFGTQNNASPSHENPKNFVRNGKPVGPLKGFSCQIVMNEALSWLEKKTKSEDETERENPFFMYVAFHEPHEPVASPKELIDRYRVVAKNELEAEYFANVHNVDLAVGKLIAKLDELNLSDNTLVIFTSDNGPETLNRYPNAGRSWGRPTPLRGMKLWTTDAGFRVAGIVHWPSKIKSGKTSDVPISSLDFLPTFCHLGGATLPEDLELDGMNITEILTGGMVKRKKPLLWAYYNALNEHQVAMRYGNWKMLAKLDHGKLPKIQNIFDGNVSDIKNAKLTNFELYDVTTDIGEANDLWPAESKTRDNLRQLMEDSYAELLDHSHVWGQ